MALLALADGVSDGVVEVIEEHLADRAIGRSMVEWQYDNTQLSITAQLYSCDGQVNFVSSVGTMSGWHGSWEEDRDHNSITIRFHHLGRPELKPVVLFKMDNGAYHGTDYRGRTIWMRKMKAFVEDTVEKTWIRVGW